MTQESSSSASKGDAFDEQADLEWRELLRRARAGELELLGDVWRPFYDDLLSTAKRQLGRDLQQKLSASDIVQESLLEAQTGFMHFNGQSVPEMRVWLEQILRHNVLDLARRFRGMQRNVQREEIFQAAETHCDIPSRIPTASSVAQHVEEDAQLARALASLPPRRRAIIEMRHRDGMSYAEIAQSMGTTETAARKLWSRAIEQLRQKLVGNDVDQ